ncbi:MAG: hypothetical protein V4615_13445 [Bacteroidota bacterium]
MKKRNTNRLYMIGSTVNFCEDNSSAWAGISAFAGVLNQVKLKKKEVEAEHEIASAPSTGITRDVRWLRKSMTEQAVSLASATFAHANTIGNHDLAARVNFTANKLAKMGKEKATGHCQAIKDAASANVGALAGYGITLTDLTALQTAIDTYRAKAQNPRLAIIQRGKAKRKIAETVRFILDQLLAKQLDRMAAIVMYTNPPFYNGYLMAREIIDLGVVHTKLKATAVDENKVPIDAVRLTVLETETQKIVRTAVSEGGGRLTINPMAVGTFDFKWEANGYVTKIETGVHIAAGKVVRRMVRMKRG